MRRPDDLLQSARSGGRYLQRALGPTGAFRYAFDPVRGAPSKPATYNLLRHAGTTWSLFELSRATGDSSFADSAERAVGYLRQHIQTQDGRVVIPDPGTAKAKLGALGLTLLAMSSSPRRREHAGEMTSLGDSILALQHPNGAYASYASVDGQPAKERASLYYPGEAMLGLLGLAAGLSDTIAAPYLQSCCRGADYLIGSQRAAVDTGEAPALPPDAWFAQALERLYALFGDERYRQHLYDLADAILVGFHWDAPEALQGCYLPMPGGACRTAARAEGILAAVRVASQDDNPLVPVRLHRWERALAISDAYLLRHAYSDDIGGLAMNASNPTIRIDTVQHAISAWIGMSRL